MNKETVKNKLFDTKWIITKYSDGLYSFVNGDNYLGIVGGEAFPGAIVDTIPLTHREPQRWKITVVEDKYL